jgi:pyruvate/2-oxoacid:ferredoxin oxidoreductase alpha subunit
MVSLEAFLTSHLMEPVEVPDQKLVDAFLPPLEPPFKLDTNKPAAFCQIVTQGEYAKFRIHRQTAMENALEVAETVDKEYEKKFSRGYGLLECYRLEDAENVLVTAGTIGSTARVVIDELREDGKRVGMVRIRLFRPFPKIQLIKSLKHARKIAVIDRNISPGQEGVFCEELKSALYSRLNGIPVFGFVMGLGGTNVSPQHIKKVFDITGKMDSAPLTPIVNLEK